MENKNIDKDLLEIQDLISIYHSKINHQALEEMKKLLKIFNRGLVKIECKDVALENQIRMSIKQSILFSMINNLELPNNIEEVCKNLLNQQSNISKYLNNLKKNYQLASNTLDLIITMGTLSTLEYETNKPFEESEYAKIEEYINQMFLESLKEVDYKYDAKTLYKQVMEYISKLTIKQKSELYMEYLCISYDRNRFNFTNECQISMRCCLSYKNRGVDIHQAQKLYDLYKQLLSQAANNYYFEQPLEDIYEDLKIVYESKYFKDQTLKKQF